MRFIAYWVMFAALFGVLSPFTEAQPLSAAPGQHSGLPGNVTTATNPMTITADLTDAPRKLLHAEIEIPVNPGPFTFTAAKWIPGSHSPAGPIADLTGITVTANGQRLSWRRDDVDLYAFHVVVPNGVTRLHIHDDFLATSQGADVAPNLAELEWSRLMLTRLAFRLNKSPSNRP